MNLRGAVEIVRVSSWYILWSMHTATNVYQAKGVNLKGGEEGVD